MVPSNSSNKPATRGHEHMVLQNRFCTPTRSAAPAAVDTTATTTSLGVNEEIPAPFPTTPYPKPKEDFQLFSPSSYGPYCSPANSLFAATPSSTPTPTSVKPYPESPSDEQLRAIIQTKEQEVHDLQDRRLFQAAEEKLRMEKELSVSRSKQEKMKADFEYNLKLLEERDEELETYDRMFSEYSDVLRERDQEISDLKVQLADSYSKIKKSQESFFQQDQHWKQHLEQQRQELNDLEIEHSKETRLQRQEYESSRMDLERQVHEKEQQILSQKRTITSQYDEALKHQESKYRIERESLLNTISLSETSTKQLKSEIESLRQSAKQQSTKIEISEQSLVELKKDLQKKSWELQEEKREKEYQIHELNGRISHFESEKKNVLKEYESKVKDLMETLRSVESQCNDERKQHNERLRKIAQSHEFRMSELQLELNNHKNRTSTLIAEEKQKSSNENQRLHLQLKDLKNRVWEKDAELLSSKKKNDTLKQTLEQRQQDIARYKKHLLDAESRCTEERRRVLALNLEHQDALEVKSSKVHAQSEEMITSLSSQRDMYKQQLNESKQQVAELNKTLRAVNFESNSGSIYQTKQLALGFDVSSMSEQNSSLKNRLSDLQDQHQKSRDLISTLRDDLEGVRKQKSQEKSCLDNRVASLSQENARLQKQLTELPSLNVVSDNSASGQQMSKLISSLTNANETIKRKDCQIEALRSKLAILNLSDANSFSFDGDPTKERLLVQENESLKKQLGGLSDRLESAHHDRDRLMAISNKLKSDLSKFRGSTRTFTHVQPEQDFNYNTDGPTDFSDNSSVSRHSITNNRKSQFSEGSDSGSDIISFKSTPSQKNLDFGFDHLAHQNQQLKDRLERLIKDDKQYSNTNLDHSVTKRSPSHQQLSQSNEIGTIATPTGHTLSQKSSEPEQVLAERLTLLYKPLDSSFTTVNEFEKSDAASSQPGTTSQRSTPRSHQDPKDDITLNPQSNAIPRQHGDSDPLRNLRDRLRAANKSEKRGHTLQTDAKKDGNLIVNGAQFPGSSLPKRTLISHRATKSQDDVDRRMKNLQTKRNQTIQKQHPRQLAYMRPRT